MRVYLAGPDVFLPEPLARAQVLKEICARHGLVGVSPLDALPAGDPPDWAALPEALRIARRNEVHIDGCAAVIANLTPFRGPSADPGTVFELGYMRARGRPVFGWTNTAAPFAARTLAHLGAAAHHQGTGEWRDGSDMIVEQFDGMADNLMIHGAVLASGGTLVATEVSAIDRWSDLKAFELAVAAAANVLLRPR